MFANLKEKLVDRLRARLLPALKSDLDEVTASAEWFYNNYNALNRALTLTHKDNGEVYTTLYTILGAMVLQQGGAPVVISKDLIDSTAHLDRPVIQDGPEGSIIIGFPPPASEQEPTDSELREIESSET